MKWRICFSALCLSGTVACLDAQSDDAIDPTSVFLDPAAPDVELDALESTEIPGSAAYLKGWAEGEKVRYWNIGGPNATFIAPYYVVLDANGSPVGEPIVDSLPGDTGYSPWWRKVIFRTTSKYAGEKFGSRQSLDLGMSLGLLEQPEVTTDVINAPLVLPSTTVDLGKGQSATPKKIRFRNKVAYWIVFGDPTIVPIDVRDMPAFPVYVFQRISEPAPLYEFLANIDQNGDGIIDASNNIFPSKPGGERYSPLWFGVIVRTSSVFVGIDRPGQPPTFDSEDDFIGGCPPGTTADDISRCDFTPTSPIVKQVIPVTSLIINCPVQVTEGEL